MQASSLKVGNFYTVTIPPIEANKFTLNNKENKFPLEEVAKSFLRDKLFLSENKEIDAIDCLMEEHNIVYTLIVYHDVPKKYLFFWPGSRIETRYRKNVFKNWWYKFLDWFKS